MDFEVVTRGDLINDNIDATLATARYLRWRRAMDAGRVDFYRLTLMFKLCDKRLSPTQMRATPSVISISSFLHDNEDI